MSEEQVNQNNKIEKVTTKALDALVDVSTLSNDPILNIQELRTRIREIKIGSQFIDRSQRREALQRLTTKLIEVEGDYINHEVEKTKDLMKYEHKAWKKKLEDAWVNFLQKVGVDAKVNKQNFAHEWMRFSNKKRKEIELDDSLELRQKERLIKMVDDDEDEMIKEVETMADDIINSRMSE